MTTSGNAAAVYRERYPQSCKAAARARRQVVAFAQNCGFSKQVLDDIELAVGEALANAVEHGRPEGAGFIEVILRRDTHSLVIEIKDNGRGFDHGSSVHRRPSAGALRGFGTFIMREFMDEIEYSERGTRLRLTKRLPARMTQRSAMQA